MLLLVGAGFAATQDNQLWVIVVLVLSAALLAPFRSCFYRHASLLSGPFEASTAVSLFVLVICMLALAMARHQTWLLSNNAWWAVVMSRGFAQFGALRGGARGPAGLGRDLAAGAPRPGARRCPGTPPRRAGCS